MLWLGLKSSDIAEFNKHGDEASLLRLSDRDRRKALKMLEKGVFVEGGEEQDWRRELQIMLMLNIKAEIQLLCEKEGGLEGWLATHISAA